MIYLLEILNRIDWDWWIFTIFDSNDYDLESTPYNCLFFLWDIEEEADDYEIDYLFRKGIITTEDAKIIRAHKKDILIDVQLIMNESEELNRPKKESLKLIWRCLKKYGLSDKYVKYLIRDLYRLL